MSGATARAINTLLTRNNKTKMKLYPHLLCSSVALWRTASAFAPSTSARSTAVAASIRTFTSSSPSSLHATSKMDQSFPTWSFDKHCPSMEWTELVDTTLTASSSADDFDKSAVVDSDLIMIGVYAPAKDGDDDDKDKSEEPPVISLTGMAAEIDQDVGGALSELMADNHKEFQHGATAGATTPTLRIIVDGKTKRYVVFGLGSTPKDDDKSNGDQNEAVGFGLGKAIASTCDAEKKITSASVLLPSALQADALMVRDLSTGFFSNLYSDNRYRTGDKQKKLVEDLTTVTVFSEVFVSGTDAAIAEGKTIAKGVFTTKDIVNAPHNVLNSESLADTAKRIAKESNGRIKCNILGKKECEARGMGAYLGVARGSETEPQFIHLTYSPPSGTVNKKVGIVGKGLLFDTGGYNIKTAMMEAMKFDCGGSAAVLGAARAVGEIAPEGVEAHFIVAACENMINSKAFVPSDILTASNGKTIEVLNTDAEGRLTLADALVFADEECGCEKIIELSTLTGACMVALGKSVAGFWTDDDDLATELESIAKSTGDKSWRMPLEKAYNKQLESKIADISNIGDRWGGAITAALFLQNFVNKKKPFAHIDIAGPVWDDATGATGHGAKMVTEWVRKQGQ